jgi:anti-anti-sigma regulatory factor
MALEAERPVPPLRPSDRCPYSRPFSPGFDDCPAFEPVTVLAVDASDVPLQPVVSCAHLQILRYGETPVHHYAACALGTAAQRQAWVARMRPVRLEVLRQLQRELDVAIRGHREAVLAAKLRLLRGGELGRLREELDAAVAELLSSLTEFVAGHADRLRDVDIDPESIVPVVEDLAVAWSTDERTSSLDVVLIPDVQATGSLPTAVGPVTTLHGSETLTIGRMEGSSTLVFAGAIDISCLHVLVSVLAGAVREMNGSQALVLDMSSVTYCDVAGLRAMVRSARTLLDGRRLEIRGAPPHLRTVMDAAGWAEAPGVVFVASEVP